MTRRSPMHNQYRRYHIAAAYARKWYRADESELSDFLWIVNYELEHYDDPEHEPRNEITIKQTRREILLHSRRKDYRVRLRPGITPWRQPFAALTADDVVTFEQRATP